MQITQDGQSFDILVDLAALVTTYLLRKKVKNWETTGIAFTIFGLHPLPALSSPLPVLFRPLSICTPPITCQPAFRAC
jgi:hypothetical protein